MRPRGRSNSGDERDLPRIGKQVCHMPFLCNATSMALSCSTFFANCTLQARMG